MGRARATVTRRLSTIAGFYRYAVEEELLDRSPAAHVRRPRVDYESHAVELDRTRLGAPTRLPSAFIRAAQGSAGAAAGCAGGRLARGSADHDAVRRGPRQPGPARDPYRRRLPRRSRPAGPAGILPGGQSRQEE